MRLLELFENKIKEAQFRQPILMYHGTTTHALSSIKTNGVVPNPPQKYWDREKDSGSEAFPSRASIGGSYWSTNMMTAWSSSTSAMRKFDAYPMIVCAMIAEQSSIADEDSQTYVIVRAFDEMIHKVHPGLARDAYGVAAMYFYDDPEAREKMLNAYAQALHRQLQGTGPINRKLTDMVFESFLMRIISHAMEKSERGSLYGIAYHLRKIKNMPQIPPTGVAEDNYARAVDLLSRRYRDSVYQPEGGPGAHTLRTDHVIGYRGAQKIVCILQLWDEESKAGPFDRPLILHYGKVPEDFLHQYHERISSSNFPGVLTPNGQWVIKPTPVLPTESTLTEAKTISIPLNNRAMRVWVSPTLNDFISLVKIKHELRGTFMNDGNLYLWDAHDAVHQRAILAIQNTLGLSETDIDLVASITSRPNMSEWYKFMKPFHGIYVGIDGDKEDATPDGRVITQMKPYQMLFGNPKRLIPQSKLTEIEGDHDDHGRALQQTGFWGRRGAGCLIMARNTGRVLLPLRSAHVEQPHTWGVFGGAIDSGEDPAEAAQREAQEEAGLNPIKMIPLYVFKKGDFQYFNFLAIIPQEVKPVLNWESENATWVYPGEWPQPLHFGVQALLKDPASVHTIRTLRKKFRQSLNETASECLFWFEFGFPAELQNRIMNARRANESLACQTEASFWAAKLIKAGIENVKVHHGMYMVDGGHTGEPHTWITVNNFIFDPTAAQFRDHNASWYESDHSYEDDDLTQWIKTGY